MKLFQIYFDDSQLEGLDFQPIHNPRCTVFFENEVIVNIEEQENYRENDYFGVLSHKFRKKMEQMTRFPGHLRNLSDGNFDVDRLMRIIYNDRPDVLSLMRFAPHDPITLGEAVHPRLGEYFKKVLKEIGFSWSPSVYEHVVYCNYFIARADIYRKYVNEMLSPAIEVMCKMDELMEDAKYPRRFPANLMIEIGVNFWPYHPFICERLFSYFVHLYGYEVTYY